MASRAAQLAIELVERGSEAVAGGFEDVTGAAKKMGDTIDSASKQADDGASRMDRVAGASDNLASKSSQATGGLGALASGLELVGLGPYAAGLQSAAMATDFFSGVGDIANLMMETQVVRSAAAKVAMIAQRGATIAATVAQKALNAAQRTSPIGLIITGVTLLVGLFVLAYKKSDTFRAIVNKAMSVAKAGVDRVVDAFKALWPTVQTVMRIVAKVVGTYVGIYVKAFQLGFKLAKAAWDGIKDAVTTVVGFIGDRIGAMRDRLAGVWNGIKSAGKAAFEAIMGPVRDLMDLIGDLIDRITHIKFPHVPDLNPFGRAGSPTGLGGGDTVNIQVVVNPAPGTTTTQATQQAQATMDAIDARLRLVGKRPVFA